MKLAFLFVLASFVTIASADSWSTDKTISGRIVDEGTGQPLIGATILVKEISLLGTITDVDGKFSIEVPEKAKTLVASYVGYLTREVEIGDQSYFDIKLQMDIETLDEIVVVGYGTVMKSDITGAVASIKTEEFNPGPVVSLSSHLQNTAPGVVMTQTSAQPGGNFKVQVRGQTSILGSNEPLYVIDGIPVSNDVVTPSREGSVERYSPDKNPLNGINPRDIVSIEVLKDASAAAIYGARGANGVVLITTKTGKGNAKLSYSSSFGIQEIANQYEYLTGEEYARVTNEWALFLGLDPVFSPAEVKSAGTGTNWLEKVSRNGSIMQHQLSASGGQEHLNYYISGNYYNHKGLIRNTELSRYSGRININSELSEYFQVGTNLAISQTDDENIHFGSPNEHGSTFNGPFSFRSSWPSNVPVYQEDGSFSVHPVIPELSPNPVSVLNISDDSKTVRILGSIYGEYQIIEGLAARINLGVDDISSKRGGYIPTTVLSGSQVGGEGELSHHQSQNLLSELTLNYTRNLGSRHQFTALAGYTFQKFSNEGFSTRAQGFSSEITNINDISGASVFLPSSSFKLSSKLISYIGRVNYSFHDRFLVTSTIRADGSTKFGPNQKWGFFPSAALGWKIHNESFFTSSAVEELKLRLSYGQTGNQEIGNKLSQSLYRATRPIILGGDEQLTVGLAPVRPENKDLRWETTTQYNIGVDVLLYGSRIQASLDAYRKITTDVLLQFTLDPTTGFETITTNAGALQNHGVEFQAKSINTSGPVEWSTGLNIAYNENRWKDRAGLPFSSFEKEFGPVQGIYAYVVEGIFQNTGEVENSAQPGSQPGQFRFKDVNDDGQITGDDRELVGQGVPDLTFGVNNQLNYRNFELSLFIQGVQGISLYNRDRSQLNNVNDLLFGRNKSREVLKRWTPENPGNSVPSGITNTVGNDFQNSLYVEDASFIRLRNVTLGYTPAISGMSSFRIYLDVQNLFTLTDWTGIDPETGNDYPNAKTYSIGFDVTF